MSNRLRPTNIRSALGQIFFKSKTNQKTNEEPAGETNSMSDITCYPLEVSNRPDQNRSFGLTGIRGLLESQGSAPVKVTLVANDQTAQFSADETVKRHEENSWYVQCNLVTHLFPDGLLTVKLSVEMDDGTVANFPDRFLAIDNSGPLAKQVRDDMVAYGTPPVIARYVDSAHFPYDSGKAQAWFDVEETPETPLSFDPSPDMETAHRHLEHWGFCILPETVPTELAEEFKSDVREAIQAGELDYEEGSSQRILNAHLLKSGRKIWLYPTVMRFLSEHFRDKPCACQTLTYINGSEQNAHQDTIHLTPYPAGFMAGVWVALEDVRPQSGELFVYPGSHRAKRLRAKDLGLEKVDEDYSSYVKFDSEIARLMEEGGFSRHNYLAKAGQILVWHENLVHGGGPRIDKEKTRFSVVSHYFAKGSVAFYDSRGEAASLEELPDVA